MFRDKGVLQEKIHRYFPEAEVLCSLEVFVFLPEKTVREYERCAITCAEYVQLVDDCGLQEARNVVEAMVALEVLSE